jgi:hypothetical protein
MFEFGRGSVVDSLRARDAISKIDSSLRDMSVTREI